MHRGIRHPGANAISSLRDRSEPRPVSDGIAWIENDSVICLEAIQNLREVLVANTLIHGWRIEPAENIQQCRPAVAATRYP